MMRYENKISEPPSRFLRNVYVDTATYSMPNHLANLELMGPDHLLFGTDSPPLATPLDDAIALVEQLPVTDEERRQVLEGNAGRLFGLQ
jgi:aminocarboxymuconate-semialdehyde decarboxylase